MIDKILLLSTVLREIEKCAIISAYVSFVIYLCV